MALDLDYYRKINNSFGVTDIQQYKINDVKNSLIKDFEKNIAYKFVEISGVGTGALIMEASFGDSSTSLGVLKKIIPKPNGEIVVGDIVNWENNNWICTKVKMIEDSYYVANIQKSTSSLLFYPNEISGLSGSGLIEIPCIVGKVVISTDNTNYIDTVDNQIQLTVSNTSINRQIKVNDVYKIGLSNYIITSVPDDISIPGLLIFKMKFTEVEQVLPVFGIELLNGATASFNIVDTLQLNVQVTNNSIPISPTPNVTYSSSNTLICTVNSSGLVSGLIAGNCIITVSANGVSDSISIEVVNVPQMNLTYSITANISPDTEIKSSMTKIFTAHKFNNGIEISSSLELSIVDTGVPINAYTFLLLENNSCSIKCNLYTHYIKLRAFDAVSGLHVDKEIKLRSLM